MHGGDIYRNQVDIDFSVNINSLGMPLSVENALKEAVNKCICYPDIKAERLIQSISRLTGATYKNIICGNGASELFPAVIRAVKPEKIMIPVPSFYGYEKAAASEECEVIYYNMKEEDGFCLTAKILNELREDLDVLILANPNTPVGNRIEPELLMKITEKCAENKIYLIIDECFIEFTENAQVYSMMNKTERYPNLIIVRAFTKIFAIPGVRLGYLVCSDSELNEKIRRQLPEWNLSVFAQEAGCAAADEICFIEKTVEQTRKERVYLKEKLQQSGIEVFDGTANFLMLYSSIPLKEELLKKKILIRDCNNFRGLGKGYYRVAVKTEEQNRILIDEIEKIFRQKGQTADGRIDDM